MYCGYLGGNQRDLARAKNQKKQQEAKRGNRSDGLTVEQRKQRYDSMLTNQHILCGDNELSFNDTHS